jgi:hypothetical protein
MLQPEATGATVEVTKQLKPSVTNASRNTAKTTTREGDSVSVSIITSVTYDDVPDSVFELPVAVRAKLKG